MLMTGLNIALRWTTIFWLVKIVTIIKYSETGIKRMKQEINCYN